MLKRTLAFILVISAVLLSACAAKAPGVSSFTLGGEIRSGVSAGADLHVTDVSKLETVAGAAGLSLLLQEDNGAVSVLDKENGVYWNALPSFENTASSVISASLVSPEGRSYLNSQDHAVACGAYQIDRHEGGLSITYNMSDDAVTAKKTPDTVAQGELLLSVTVDFSVTEEGFGVSVDCGKIFVSPGFVLERLSLLPYFGALDASGSAGPGHLASGGASAPYFGRNFLLVPDGCGAVMYTDAPDPATQNLTLPLYTPAADGTVSPVGCFGVRCESSAFAGVVTAGDALASIRAMRSEANADGVFLVYPEFSVTPALTEGRAYYYGTPYTGTIGAQYRFLRNTEGSYISMAAVCREALIRSGALPDGSARESGYPLNVSFIMSVKGSLGTRASSFDQIEDIAGLLKAKGVNKINFILNGAFSQGLYQTGGDSFRTALGLGGRKGLSQLCAAAAAQDIDVYAGVNLLSVADSGGAALQPNGKKLSSHIENPLGAYVASSRRQQYAASPEGLDENTVNLLKKTEKLSVSGYAVNDTGSGLHADLRAGATAAETLAAVQKNLSALATQKKLLVQGAAFCDYKNADMLTDLPLTAFHEDSDSFSAVPLLPAILHGSMVYSGPPVYGATAQYVLRFLKCIEYGAAIYTQWCFLQQTPQYYEQSFNDIAERYVKASEQLSDLCEKRITGHEKLENGVFATLYDGGTVVYVNYHNHSVNVGNISVPPYDFLRIN